MNLPSDGESRKLFPMLRSPRTGFVAFRSDAQLYGLFTTPGAEVVTRYFLEVSQAGIRDAGYGTCDDPSGGRPRAIHPLNDREVKEMKYSARAAHDNQPGALTLEDPGDGRIPRYPGDIDKVI